MAVHIRCLALALSVVAVSASGVVMPGGVGASNVVQGQPEGLNRRGHAAWEGRLSLATREQLEVYSGWDESSVGGEDPIITADPAEPTRSAMRCRVTGTTGTQNSGWFVQFVNDEFPGTEPSELYIGFSVYLDHFGSPKNLLRFFEILKFDTFDNFITAAGWLENTSTKTRWSSYTSEPVYTAPLIPKEQWVRVRVYYRQSTGTNPGWLKVWIGDEATHAAGMGDPVISAPHDIEWPIYGFRLRCWTSGPMTALPGNKDAHFRRLAWGDEERDADWGPHNTYELQFGQTATSDDGVHVDVRLHHYLEMPLHGSLIDDGALVGQFQYRKTGETDWTNSGPAEDYSAAIAADPLNECAVGNTAAGLDPAALYEFRVTVTNDAGFKYYSNTSKLRTPSASGSAPTNFSVVFGSCSSELEGGNGSTPHLSYVDMLDLVPAPRTFVHLGDVCYADANVSDLPPATINEEYRQRVRMQVYHSMEQARVYSSMASSFMRDDHEVIDGWYGAGEGAPLKLIAESDQAFVPYLTDERTLKPLPGVQGGDHRYWETARCLFIVSDVRYHKNLDADARTYWGTAQVEAIKNLLKTNTKPMVFWFAQTVLGTTPTAPEENDETPAQQEICSNWQEWLDERDDIIQTFAEHNPTTTRLFIGTADRHHIVIHDTGLPDFPNVGPEYSVSPLDKSTQGGPQMVGIELYKGLGNWQNGDYVHFYTLIEIDEPAVAATFTVYDATDPRKEREVIFTLTHDDMDVPPPNAVANDPVGDSGAATNADDVTASDVTVQAGEALVVFAWSEDPDDAARGTQPIARFGATPLAPLFTEDDSLGHQTLHAWLGTGLAGIDEVTVDWGTRGGELDAVGVMPIVVSGIDASGPIDVVASLVETGTSKPSVTITPTVENTFLLSMTASNDPAGVIEYSAKPLGDRLDGSRRTFAQFQQTGPMIPLTMGVEVGADTGRHLVGAIAFRPGPRLIGDLNEDGAVDVVDLFEMLGAWGACPPPCVADLTGDGTVDIHDLLLLLGNWTT